MTLRDLMDVAFDECWFLVVEPENGNQHHFWNADYIGGYKEVMEELAPFLDREVQSFNAEMIWDPEPEDPEVVDKIPAIWVDLERK